MFWDRDECSGTGTNVLHGSSDSLGSELNLSQGTEMRTSSQMNPIWFLFHLGELSRLAGLARLIIWTGHVTRGNFRCNLQRNGVALHCIALQVARKTSSCDIPCLQLVSQRKIALQVAEKVEAAATRQVAACGTPTATCLAIFWEGTNHNTI